MPFLQTFLDSVEYAAKFASNCNLVLRAEFFSALTTQVIHGHANGCGIIFISLNGGDRGRGGVLESEVELVVGGAAGGDVDEAEGIVEEFGLLAAISTEVLEM